ncbi:hypothetical protein ATI02_6334 [Pseudomonas baetica]|uniref:Uncharacterized protein n=1 Tax=Pseudomonas baetica TaxID=674054 RepID=A0ABX4Q916_9PSED|nr:hypothetical protein [Pseudomonas baetica]PKA73212.1 hypothetical protein ATI02_6334 [Pseudomonas baetica]PTC18925.1 hypothetical protein C0J26_15085 [Pseudomonas baetica]
MTIDMKLNAVQKVAEDSRTEIRQKQLNIGVMADSPKPVIVGVADGELVPVGILKSAAAQAGTTTVARQPDLPIRVTVFAWENPNDRDRVMLMGCPVSPGDDPNVPESWPWELLVDEAAPPVNNRPKQWDVTVPPGRLRDIPTAGSASPTVWKIECRGSFDGNVQYSEMATYSLDTYAPFHNKGDVRVMAPTRLDFPLPATARIDSEYLETIRTTGMEFTLPVTDTRWDLKNTDKVYLYLSSTLRPTRQLTPTLIVNPVPTDGKVSIPMSEIAKLANGTVWLIMAYEDAAGNRSADMLAHSRVVEFVPLPILAAPIIDAANTAGDNTIDLADVRFYEPLGVPIRVQRPPNTQDTDKASVFFESFETIPLDPPVQEFGTKSELIFRIKWIDLKTIYASLAGGDPDVREVGTRVFWTWMRGITPRDSTAATPDLDFSYPGEENPDEPDEINKSLARVQLRGVDNILNTLNPADLLTDPKVIIPLPKTKPLGDDVVCSWYYDGRLVEEFSAEGLTQYESTMPAQRVVDGGPGNKLTYWRFSYIGGLNSQRSLDETVTVTTVSKEVPEPVIDRLFDNNSIINCPTLGFVRGVRPPLPFLTFRVAANPVLAGLQSITAHWVGTTDAAGALPIAGTDQDVSIPVTGTEATTGITGQIAEYLTKILPIQTRPDPFPVPAPPITYASLKYTAVWTDGTRATSNATVKIISLVNGNREFCHEVR